MGTSSFYHAGEPSNETLGGIGDEATQQAILVKMFNSTVFNKMQTMENMRRSSSPSKTNPTSQVSFTYKDFTSHGLKLYKLKSHSKSNSTANVKWLSVNQSVSDMSPVTFGKSQSSISLKSKYRRTFSVNNTRQTEDEKEGSDKRSSANIQIEVCNKSQLRITSRPAFKDVVWTSELHHPVPVFNHEREGVGKFRDLFADKKSSTSALLNSFYSTFVVATKKPAATKVVVSQSAKEQRFLSLRGAVGQQRAELKPHERFSEPITFDLFKSDITRRLRQEYHDKKTELLSEKQKPSYILSSSLSKLNSLTEIPKTRKMPPPTKEDTTAVPESSAFWRSLPRFQSAQKSKFTRGKFAGKVLRLLLKLQRWQLSITTMINNGLFPKAPMANGTLSRQFMTFVKNNEVKQVRHLLKQHPFLVYDYDLVCWFN